MRGVYNYVKTSGDMAPREAAASVETRDFVNFCSFGWNTHTRELARY